MFVPFLIGQAAVVLMLTGTVLYNNADMFLNYNIPASGIARIAMYFAPYLVNLTMPVAMAIAASLAISRLSRDSEITVMRSAGVSLHRIFVPVIFVGIALSAVDFAWGEHVVPWSNRQYEKTMRQLSQGASFLVPQEGQVVQSPDRRYTASIGRIELHGKQAKLHNVMLIVAQPGTQDRTVILADTADYADGVWRLHNAQTHIYENGGIQERFVRTPEAILNFQIAERVFNAIYLQLPLYSTSSTVSFRELGERIATNRRLGWVNPQDLLDYHFKLSVPFSCLVFAIVCPPLALKFARAGSFMGVLLSIVLVFVYWNTLLAAKIIGAKYPNVFPPAIAGWGQDVVFAAIGLYVLRKSE